MGDIDFLQDHLASLGRIVLGYSGGVDSALLAVADPGPGSVPRGYREERVVSRSPGPIRGGVGPSL